jgi:hypothetical protein
VRQPLVLSIAEISDLENFTSEEWLIMEELVSLLLSLEASTRTLCGDVYATASIIIPTIRATINHITITLATWLDPRFKEASFKKKENTLLAVNIVKTLLSEIKDKSTMLVQSTDPFVKTSGTNSIGSAQSAFDILDCIQSDIRSRSKLSSTFYSTHEDKLNSYLESGIIAV